MPNIQHYYLFQIWPNFCSQDGSRHNDKLRDVQRCLSRLYSNLSVMPTLAFPSRQSCHFILDDHERMGLSLAPLLERDFFDRRFDRPITAPDLLRVRYTSDKRDEIVLEFDQPMEWDESLASMFFLEGQKAGIVTGTPSGNVITLNLATSSAARTITYLADKTWDRKTLLFGRNGIAALTFCEVPVLDAKDITNSK